LLGLKFTDRTFRFANLLNVHDGLRLTSAGAGLIPFTSMDRGIIRPDGAASLTDVLNRALDREGVERSGAAVVLDGRIIVRALFPLQAGTYGDDHELRARVEWEIGTRYGGVDPVTDIHVDWIRWRGTEGTQVVDAWGIPQATLDQYRTVIEGVGCEVVAWDCDPWAMARVIQACTGGADQATIAAIHVEAESLEIALIRREGSVGTTSMRSDIADGSVEQWDSDEPDAVATEIGRAIDVLSRRWFPADPGGGGEVETVWFTGSVENPDALLGALVRILKTRVEMIDIAAWIGIDESLASSPLIESNLGSFALCIGGALSDIHL
jgi:hypothetical protein